MLRKLDYPHPWQVTLPTPEPCVISSDLVCCCPFVLSFGIYAFYRDNTPWPIVLQARMENKQVDEGDCRGAGEGAVH
jgi:hypothetical protein